MSIRSICQTNVVTIDKRASLQEASVLMSRYHVGCVIVIDKNDPRKIPQGIITDRDLALAIGKSTSPNEFLVERFMQSNPVTIDTDMGIYEAITIMRNEGIKRLPVVDYEGSIYGVVSAHDLLSLMVEEIHNIASINDVRMQKENIGSINPEVLPRFQNSEDNISHN